MVVLPSQNTYCLLQWQYGTVLGGIILLEHHYSQILSMTPQQRADFVATNEVIFDEIFANVGIVDATIRDQQNYRLFIQLLSENAIPTTVLHDYVSRFVSQEGMRSEIGATGDDTVFQRSFSALFLTGIVHADRQLHVLTEQELDQIAQAAIELFIKERDLRSYVNESSGWAHSIAHSADLLCAIIQHPQYPIRYTAKILQGIRVNSWKGYVFTDDEEERFCNVMESILNKGIDEALLIEWFEQLFDQLEMIAFERGYDATWFKARTNLLNMSKTFYFYLKFSNRNEKLRGIVSMFIQKWLKMN